MNDPVLAQGGTRHNENLFLRVIRLGERLDLQAIQEQERTRQAEIELRRLEQLNAAQSLALEKERLELRRERLKVWSAIAGKALMAGGFLTVTVTTIGAALAALG